MSNERYVGLWLSRLFGDSGCVDLTMLLLLVMCMVVLHISRMEAGGGFVLPSRRTSPAVCLFDGNDRAHLNACDEMRSSTTVDAFRVTSFAFFAVCVVLHYCGQ